MTKIKNNLLSIISITVILAITLPMLYYFGFAVLGGDDFLYGRETMHALQDTGSYMNAVKIAFSETWSSYFNWQGTFFSIFLMYLHPGIISLALYRIVLALIFILGITAPIIAAFTINKHYLKAPKKYVWLVLASYIFVSTQYMPSIYQAYYWYNSVIFYQFTYSIAFLFVAAFVFYRHTNSKILRIFILCSLFIMDIMIAGSNFPLGLVFAVCFSVYIIMAFIKKFKQRKTDAIIFAVFMAIFLLNVLAPGNSARQGSYSVTPSLFSAAYASVRDMMLEVPGWITSTVTVGIICAALPLSRKIVQNASFKFAHPALAGALLVLVLLAQYFPVEYGLGSKGPERVENLRFMTATLGIWLFFINMFGYNKDKEQPVNRYIAMVLALVFLAMPLNTIGINQFTSYKMADQITGGQLDKFSKVISSELSQLEDTQSRDPVYYGDHVTNEFLHPDITFWFYSGIWDYYRKVPKRD